MNLLKSTGTFGFYTIISRLLGYLRDILIAIFLGTGLLADASSISVSLAVLLILALEVNAIFGKQGPMTSVKGVIHCGVALTIALYVITAFL